MKAVYRTIELIINVRTISYTVHWTLQLGPQPWG